MRSHKNWRFAWCNFDRVAEQLLQDCGNWSKILVQSRILPFRHTLGASGRLIINSILFYKTLFCSMYICVPFFSFLLCHLRLSICIIFYSTIFILQFNSILFYSTEFCSVLCPVLFFSPLSSWNDIYFVGCWTLWRRVCLNFTIC